MEQVDFPAYALSMHKQNVLRITKGNNSNRIGASPFYSNTNVHLVNINVFAKMMKFQYCLLKILRKNQNVVDKELQREITQTELAPSPYFSIINVYLVDINVFAKFYEILSLPFQDIEKPKHRRLTDMKM